MLKSELMIDFVEVEKKSKITFKSFFLRVVACRPFASLIILHESAPLDLKRAARLISRIEKLFGGNDHHF